VRKPRGSNHVAAGLKRSGGANQICTPEEIMNMATIFVIAFIAVTVALFLAVELHTRKQARTVEAHKQPRERDVA
jgi:hypothetical protein